MDYTTSELVSIIQKNEQIIQERAQALGCKTPSIKDGWNHALEVDTAAILAQNEMLNAIHELNSIVRGPQSILTAPSIAYWSSLHCIVKLGFANAIPVDDDESDPGKTFEEIAKDSPLSTDTVRRIFKHATTLFIFREEPKGVIRHTAASRYLAQNSDVQNMVSLNLEGVWQSAGNLATALLKWPRAIEPTETAYQVTNNTDLNMFSYMSSKSPEKVDQFVSAMAWLSQSPSLNARHTVDGYPWNEVSNGKVVDVGGSTGWLCCAIARKYPSISFIVQDRPDVVANASVPEDLVHANINFMAHDFFTEQPIRDADVYYLSRVVHDWSDYYAAKILKNIVKAMKKDAVILIIERVLADNREIGPYSANAVRGHDMTMLAMLNGKERDMHDWQKLLADVEPKLLINRVFRPKGAANRIIEIKLQE